jgi:hypothetical protein
MIMINRGTSDSIKTFVEATISTLGNRLNEIILPISKDVKEKSRFLQK